MTTLLRFERNVCRVLTAILKLKTKTGSSRRSLKCERRDTPMYLATASIQAGNERIIGENATKDLLYIVCSVCHFL